MNNVCIWNGKQLAFMMEEVLSPPPPASVLCELDVSGPLHFLYPFLLSLLEHQFPHCDVGKEGGRERERL